MDADGKVTWHSGKQGSSGRSLRTTRRYLAGAVTLGIASAPVSRPVTGAKMAAGLLAIGALIAACQGTPIPSEAASPSLAAPSASARASEPSIAEPTIDGLFEVDASGRRIAVRCWGTGPTVVLEDGGPGISQFSDTTLRRALGETTRVCLHDRAGIGLSDPAPDECRDADDVVDDLHAALGTAGVEPPFVLVGSSFGGMVVTHFADRFGDQVAGVVTLDTPAPSLDLTPENFPEGVCDHPANVEHLEVVAGFENRFAENPPMFDAPLIVVTASGGGQSSAGDQAFWLQTSGDARQVILAGGHEIYRDDPERVLAEILTLLPSD